jgi:hypothetical protein
MFNVQPSTYGDAVPVPLMATKADLTGMKGIKGINKSVIPGTAKP